MVRVSGFSLLFLSSHSFSHALTWVFHGPQTLLGSLYSSVTGYNSFRACLFHHGVPLSLLTLVLILTHIVLYSSHQGVFFHYLNTFSQRHHELWLMAPSMSCGWSLAEPAGNGCLTWVTARFLLTEATLVAWPFPKYCHGLPTEVYKTHAVRKMWSYDLLIKRFE